MHIMTTLVYTIHVHDPSNGEEGILSYQFQRKGRARKASKFQVLTTVIEGKTGLQNI